MIRKIIAVCMIIFFTAAIPATVFAESESIPIDGDETNDYLKASDIIRATGHGMPPSNLDKRDSFAKTFAREAARLDALRQFLDSRISSDSSGIWKGEPKIITWKTLHDNKIFKLIKNHARQVGNAKFSDDGLCEVIMEVVVPADWNN